MRKRTKIMIGLLVVLFTSLAGIFVYGHSIYQEAEKAVDASQQELERGDKSEKREEKVDPSKDNVSILFIGVDDSDAREGSSSLADALVVATFNKKENSINLVSIPRDSYVDVPYQLEKDKITHVHAKAGLDETVDTVEGLLDVPVDYYVRLDFEAFVKVVDTLGGVPFDVPYYMEESNSQDEKGSIVLQPGKQQLTGEEALAVARTRKYDNDLMRGQRQMELLDTILKETMSVSNLTKYGDLINDISDHLTTNMPFNEMVSLHSYITDMNGVQMDKMQLSGNNLMKNGVYYFELENESVEAIQKDLREHLGLPTSVADSTEQKNTINSGS
ncbi:MULTISPECIES: LCP family protein [Allobacillus]|uniref:LytR family transcriptional regulator n=1 Tax=Allobacillus salarius TaxID=1955272 RepID=A0A556PR05_9BACI|nr:LCP family protein [Allobacillus salarius]TSJ66815.1 LytR family transcriptional regulator [Allobacillus salarius]